MQPNSVLEIDLAVLAENVRQIRAYLSPSTQLCAVVKADAYGLGAAVIAPELQCLGVRWHAVYNPQQAAEILEAGITANILIFMPVMDIEPGTRLAEAAAAGRIHFTVHSTEQMQSLAAAATQMKVVLPVQVEIDTGMSRGGQLAGAANELLVAIAANPSLSLAGIFTHPSSADTDAEFTNKQLLDFERAISLAPRSPGQRTDEEKTIVHHFANTFAAIADKRFHRDMVRVGLGLWGYPSINTWETADRNGVRLHPVARWVSKIVHIRDVPAGSPIGYGQTSRAARPTRIGIIPTGYADGYPLLLSNRGIVRVGASLQVAHLLGRVNMDQIIVDLTDMADVYLGQEAELISSDPSAPNAMHRLAELAQSHPYEMLCRISPKIPRKYVKK